MLEIRRDAFKRIASIVMSVALALAMCVPAGAVAAGAEGNAGRDIAGIVEGMTLDEKVSQMIVPALRTWEGENVTDLAAVPELAAALQKHQYGGVILFGQNVVGTEQTARLVSDLQKNNAGLAATTHFPYLMPVDEEGGAVTRLSTGTRMTGSMAVGATGADARDNAFATGQVIGEELAALGFNADFAPDIDVNSNPANPVIGTRSFSDVADTVAQLGTAFAEGLSQNGVIGTYKHFPGHGDTGTDSHTGLSTVTKTYDQLEATELVPFRAAIADGADMIMTAHICLPNVDDEVEFADGTKGCYPATMSKKIIAGILRDTLGYDGVVVTDALEMDALYSSKFVEGDVGTTSASASTEYKINLAEKIVNAGVDLLLIPTDLNSASAARFYDDYIDGIIAKVQGGAIPESRIDESVTRILKMKDAHGILDTDVSGDGIEQTAERAKAVVGSEEHHAVEMGIAKQAVTLLKNSGDVLPLSGNGKRIVIVGRLKGDAVAIANAVERLQAAGLLDENARVDDLAAGTAKGEADAETRITIDYYGSNLHFTGDLLAAIADADAVVCFSTNWGLYSVQPSSGYHQGVQRTLELAKGAGAQAVLLSNNLPYDAARYQSADAIMACYMSTGMDVDPTARADGSANPSAYNANVIAALCLMFGDGTPTGTLPVDVPTVVGSEDGTVSYSASRKLYERGFGLTYAQQPASAPAKKANTLAVKGKTVKASAKTLKKKTVTVAAKKAVKVTGAKGAVTFKRASVSCKKKLAAQAKKKIAVATNGKITLKKGLKKGTYKVAVKVTAAGNANYEKGTKTATVKITVG